LNLNNIQKKGLTSELHDLVRSRTELECVVADLEKVDEATGGKKEEVESELRGVEKRIKKVQHDLEAAKQSWQKSKEEEAEERKRYANSFLPFVILSHSPFLSKSASKLQRRALVLSTSNNRI
jgi:septal ring factor EnvC (AmiA/AmiB activator)